MISCDVKTHHHCEFVNVTNLVESAVEKSNIDCGMVFVFVRHTTAGITINESADPDVRTDILAMLDKIVPKTTQFFLHSEGNSDAHIKTLLTGSTVSIPFENKKLALGTWQAIYFCEYDGPRKRTLTIQIVKAE